MLQQLLHVVNFPLRARKRAGVRCLPARRSRRFGLSAAALVLATAAISSDGKTASANSTPAPFESNSNWVDITLRRGISAGAGDRKQELGDNSPVPTPYPWLPIPDSPLPATGSWLLTANSPLAQVNFEELEDFEYWQRLCRLQAAAQNYEEAQQACEQAIEIRPEDASIWADHSGVLLQLEKYPEAIASADLSLTYNLENSLAFTYQCAAFYALEDYEMALDKCNEALRFNGDWGNESPALAWRYRGQILDQQDRSELALVAFERTLLLVPADSQTLTYQCSALLNLERYTAAIASCQAALDGNQSWGPESPALAWFYQGRSHGNLGDYEAAIAAFDQAIAIDPEQAETWTEQGGILEILQRPTEALTSYTQAATLNPESSRALVGQCTTLNQLQRYEDALAACQQALQGDGDWWQPGAAQSWSEQAQALAGAGMLEEALAAANRAIGIRGGYAEAWNNRSVVFWYLGIQAEADEAALQQFAAAVDSAQQSIELNPDAARPWANLGRIFRSQGQLLFELGDTESAASLYQDAREAYEKALLLEGEDAGIWANYSVILWLMGDYDASLAAANQALRIDDTSPQAWQNRGAALVALGEFPEAQVSYERAVALDEQDATAWASLGIIQLRLDQVDVGMASLEKALALEPGNALANSALELLPQDEL